MNNSNEDFKQPLSQTRVKARFSSLTFFMGFSLGILFITLVQLCLNHYLLVKERQNNSTEKCEHLNNTKPKIIYSFIPCE